MGLTQKLGTIPLAIQTDSSNNIGIGGAANASYKLAVTGASLFSSSVFLGSNANSADNSLLTIKQASTAYNNGIYLERGGERNGYFMYVGGALDSLTFRRNYFGTQSDVMSLTRDGNVGIGTSSPTAWNGNQGLLVTQTGTGNTNTIYSLQSAATSVDTGGILEAFSTNTTSGSKALGSIVFLRENTSTTALSSYTGFYTNSGGTVAERMRITSGGDVGIGGSISGQKLYVKAATANGSTNAFLIHDSNGSDLLFVRSDGLITTGGAVSPYNFNPGGRVMYVNSSGQVGSNPSTRESKININPISDVSYIYDLNPVSFYFRKTNMETYEYTDEYYDEIRYGFIADEVEPLNTDLVSYNVNEDGSKKMAGVEYISMIPVLVKALQEQKKLIEELSAKVTALENK